MVVETIRLWHVAFHRTAQKSVKSNFFTVYLLCSIYVILGYLKNYKMLIGVSDIQDMR